MKGMSGFLFSKVGNKKKKKVSVYVLYPNSSVQQTLVDAYIKEFMTSN